MGLDESARRVDRLQQRLARLHGAVERIETHISWVLLAGPHAYKLKKPLRLPFLDFSTLEARHRCCEEELRLNRRLAPSLYLGVLAVHDDGVADPSFDGPGPVVDHAVHMRRMPAHALASEQLRAGALQPDDVTAFAQRLAAFHREAAADPPDPAFGSPARVRAEALQALDTLAGHGAGTAVGRLRAGFETEAQRLAPRWAQRLRDGHVREVHGDLHLANVAVLDDGVTAFDGIEFDPALRWIDTASDLGFLLMDLQAHGRDDLAHRALDAYLQASGDHGCLDLLRWYRAYRAVVRSMVASLGAADPTAPTAQTYLGVAERLLLAPTQPGLLVMHGLPGSGKSHLALQWLQQACAVRLRSDVERQRLPGPPQPERYGAAATEATYARLLELARPALAAGWPVILDAAFLLRAQRDAARALARQLVVPCRIIDCQAPMAVLRTRVRKRSTQGGDPSEADENVLERLADAAEPLEADELAATLVVRTDGAIDLGALDRVWRGAAV